jgi:hypothetical protein
LLGAILVILLLLLILLALVLRWPHAQPPGSDAPDRETTIGTSPSAEQVVGQMPPGVPGSTAGGSGSGVGGGSTSSDTSGTGATAPGGTVTAPGAAPTTVVRPGSLTVNVEVNVGILVITVQNVGGGPATWHSVALRLAGVNLVVSSADGSVTVAVVQGAYCATPTAGPVTLAGGALSTFTLTVLGVLSSVQSAVIDGPPCPA